jgi:Uma2 family endonuclease
MSTVATFSLEQYERMAAAGAFDGLLQQRVEFIRGEIREMTPIGTFHDQAVNDLTDWSYDVAPRGRFTVRVQSTLRIPAANSAPQPDVMWVTRKKYTRKHPDPGEVHLLIEVAESSILDDRGEKRDLYAEAMIPDYWIVNIKSQTIEVYRQPDGRAYQWSQTFGLGNSVSPLALPEAKLEVASLFEG